MGKGGFFFVVFLILLLFYCLGRLTRFCVCCVIVKAGKSKTNLGIVCKIMFKVWSVWLYRGMLMEYQTE